MRKVFKKISLFITVLCVLCVFARGPVFAGSLSDYAEDALMNHLFATAYTPVATIYIGLSTADPLDTAAGIAEPSGNNYAREAITFDAAATRKVVQADVVTFNQASGAWGTITHWFICDHLSNTTWGTNVNLLAHGSFTSSFSPVAGNTPSIADQEVEVEVSAGSGEGWTSYLVHKLLDLMFRNTAYSAPATYIALLDSAGADADTTLTTAGKEATWTSYARVLVNKFGGASPAWEDVASSATQNANAVTFATVDGSPSIIVGMAIVDAATLDTGNVLIYDNDQIVDQTPNAGDTVQFAIGAIDVSLQ